MKSIITIAMLVLANIALAQETPKSNYKNEISLLPFQINTSNVGVGLQYERYLDEKSNFSVVLPLYLGVHSFFYNVGGDLTPLNDGIGFSVNPGLRLYFTEPRSFNWYLGTNVFYSYDRKKFTYNVWPPTDYTNEFSQQSLASTINVGFKGTVQDRITYTFNVDNGFTFMNRTKNETRNQTVNNTESVDYYLGFKVGFGYKF